MTVWVAHQKLTLDEEKHIHERAHLVLPFGDMPDMSLVHSQHECRQLLRLRYPEDSPESIALKCDRLWNRFDNLHIEDIVAVPLPLTGQVALGQISGSYCHEIGKDGNDVHLIPVRWYPKLHRMQAFGRNRHMFADMGNPLYTIGDAALRRSVTDKLPYRYNRFVRLRWVLGILIVLGTIRMVVNVFLR